MSPERPSRAEDERRSAAAPRPLFCSDHDPPTSTVAVARPPARSRSATRSRAGAAASLGSTSWRRTPYANSCSRSLPRGLSTPKPRSRARARAARMRLVFPIPASPATRRRGAGPEPERSRSSPVSVSSRSCSRKALRPVPLRPLAEPSRSLIVAAAARSVLGVRDPVSLRARSWATVRSGPSTRPPACQA
jgi:hypothetical protein